MAVGEFGGWAIHRVPSQVLLGVPDGARVVRVTPPVLGDQAEQLPSEMEATRHRDKVLEAVCSGVLVCQRLLRPHDPVHSELITVGQNELVFQLQLLTDLPQDGRGACQAGLVLGEQLPHAQLGAMGGRGELGDRDLAEGIDMLDENGLDNHPQAGLLALKALLVGQNLGTNKKQSEYFNFPLFLPFLQMPLTSSLVTCARGLMEPVLLKDSSTPMALMKTLMVPLKKVPDFPFIICLFLTFF